MDKIVLDFKSGDIDGLYRITSELYGCDFYCSTWKDVSNFVTDNIGDKIAIDIVSIESLPYGFYFISKGKVIDSVYEESSKTIIRVKPLNEDCNGNTIKCGSKVKLRSAGRIKNSDDKEILDKVYKVDCVLNGVAYLKLGYGKVGFRTTDVEVVKDEPALQQDSDSRNLF